MCLSSRQRCMVALQPSAGAVGPRPARADGAPSTNSTLASCLWAAGSGGIARLGVHRSPSPHHGLSISSTAVPMRNAGRLVRKAFTPDLKFLQFALARSPPIR
jgi:hypothetical protein